MMLDVQGLTVKYGSLTVVNDLSFSVEAGQWVMIAGPNGAGKSTALGAIMQGIPYDGEILFEGRNLRAMRGRDRARCVGALMQHNAVGYAFSVEEIVRLGRYAHRGMLSAGNRDADEAAVSAALSMTGMAEKRAQNALTLSGGELQRTFLAQVFAQNPRLLILDEPTNHLDLLYQKQIFSLIREWLLKENRAVVSVVHDLSLARMYGTHAVLMKDGKCVSKGEAKQVLCRDHLESVYGMDVYAWMQSLLSQWRE